MNQNPEIRYYKEMTEPGFPVDVVHRSLKSPGVLILRHWHEHMQFFVFISGQAVVTIGSERLLARGGDIIIINPRELHSADCVEGPLRCEIIRVDFSFLSCRTSDGCQTRFIEPLENGGIVFRHLVQNDLAVSSCVDSIVGEFDRREPGFELSVKGSLYSLMAMLFRSYCVRQLGSYERNLQERRMKRFSDILDYVDQNLFSSMRIADLASRSGVTQAHFCRIFADATGMTPVEYINRQRVARAERMLRDTGRTVTEIAYACGFGDANYFSRIFRRYRGVSPKRVRDS